MKEMCPLFGTVDILFEKHIKGVMSDFIEQNNISKAPRKQFIGGMKGMKIFIHSDLLKYYLEIGLTVTHIYQVVEYKGFEVFKPYADLIMKYRHEALSDPDKIPTAQMYKSLGNAAYESLRMNKFKFHDILYVQGEEKAVQMVNSKMFKNNGFNITTRKYI